MRNPTITVDGTKFWNNEIGMLHREDGPAYKDCNGMIGWYINGTDIEDKVNQWMEDCNINQDPDCWTDAEKTMFRLKFA